MLAINTKSEWIQHNHKHLDVLLTNCGFNYSLNNRNIMDEICDSIYVHLTNHINKSEILDSNTFNAIDAIIDDLPEIFSINKNKYKKMYSLYELVLEEK